jgi:hypothetical protein
VNLVPVLLLATALALPASAQQLKLNLDHLAAKAANTVDLSLTGGTLQFAAKFMQDGDPEEARVKKLINGLQGIYIRSFTFKQSGAWTPADLAGVRAQLRPPEWSRILGFKSAEDGEDAEIHVRNQGSHLTGLAILVTGPREFTVVNIVGHVDLDSLADLSGHFGMPKLEPQPKRKQP